MACLFMTDHGPVRVSDREANLLQLAQDIKRDGVPDYPHFKPILARADAIKAACVRFAKFTEGVRE